MPRLMVELPQNKRFTGGTTTSTQRYLNFADAGSMVTTGKLFVDTLRNGDASFKQTLEMQTPTGAEIARFE